jgi:hypothetical protein
MSAMQWASDRAGFRPSRLRSPEGAGMLVITASLVIELDITAVRAVAKSM